MKKIFVAIAAIAAFTLVSCDGNVNKGTDADSTAVVTEQDDLSALEEAIESGDEEAIKAELSKIEDYVQNLDSSEVKKFAYKLQEFAANHKDDLDKLATGEFTVTDIINGVKSIPSTATSLGKEAGEAATSDANKVNEQTKAAAEAAKEQIKDAAKAKANEAAEAAAQKANEQASKAINDAAQSLKDRLKK